MAAGPERSCVVCRGRQVKHALLRIAARAGRLEADWAARLPGRGAYVHPSKECLAGLYKPAVFERALRLQPGTVRREQVDQLLEDFEQAVDGPAGRGK